MDVQQLRIERRALAEFLPRAIAEFQRPPTGAEDRLRGFASPAYREPSTTPLSVVENHGLRWYLPPHSDDDKFAGRMARGWLPVKEIAQSRVYERGGVMLDIGANVGTNCIPRIMLGDFKAAYCAEPEPQNYAALRETVKANSLEGLVLPDRLAISDHDGEAGFLVKANGMARHRLAGQSTSEATVKVPVRRLDTWIEELGIDPADVTFVKSDCQGFDGKVLAGAERLLGLRRASWQIEYAPRLMAKAGTSHDWMCDFLSKHFTHFINTGGHTDFGLHPIDALREQLAYLVVSGSFTELVLLNR